MRNSRTIKYIFVATFIFSCCKYAMAQSVIDVHSHIIPSEYLAMLDAHGASMCETFPLPHWDAEAHIRFMEKAGISLSVLSLPAPQPFFGNSAETQKIIRHINNESARLKKREPGKFRFCASLPLPDVAASVKEAIYALDTLHADAIKLATNSAGQYLGDATLDTLMSVLNQRHALIIIHPVRPTPCAPDIIQTTPLAVYEYPAETTRAILNLISRNVLARYSNIRIIVPHCGSFLPLAIPRMKSIVPTMQAKGYMSNIDWRNNLSKLYYDLAGNPEPDIIKTILTISEPTHILYGSDYPYLPDSVITNKLKSLKETISNDATLKPYLQLFLSENARHLFEH